MKKVSYCIILLLTFMFFNCCRNDVHVKAKEVVSNKVYTNIFGDVLGSIDIYDNGEIIVKYKYGLRRVDLLYCQKGENCDNNMYGSQNIMESSVDNTYKNEENELAVYKYKVKLNGEEYRLKVEAYFGTNSGYSGTENVNGSYTISSLQSVDTGENYIKINSDEDLNNDELNGLMSKLKEIANTIILPIIYVLATLVLVVKGALLGVDIVRSADDPSIRAEKVRALKWLVIGVAITYTGSSLIGVITGFFKNMF